MQKTMEKIRPYVRPILKPLIDGTNKALAGTINVLERARDAGAGKIMRDVVSGSVERGTKTLLQYGSVEVATGAAALDAATRILIATKNLSKSHEE